MLLPALTVVRFGIHALDLRTGVLRRGHQRAALQPQPAQLLTLLIEHAGEVVTREEIRERLWPDVVVAYDQNINFAIRQIRIALGPDAELVQTVPRRGYRFVGAVAPAKAPRPALTKTLVAAASVLLTVGVGGGVAMGHAPTRQFVYDHVVHLDRCPYVQVLLGTHRTHKNS